MSLPEHRRRQLDNIVRQMISNGEADENIQFVVNDFSTKYQNESEMQKGFIGKVGEDISKRASNIKQTFTKTVTENQDPISTGLQAAGQIAGGITDIAGRAVGGIVKAITPNRVEQSIKQMGRKVLETPAGRAVLEAANQGMEVYQEFKENHPTIAKDVEAVINIAALFPVGRGARATEELAAGVAKKGAQVVGQGIKTTTKKVGMAITPIEEGVKTTLQPITKSLTEEGVSKVNLASKLQQTSQKYEKYIAQAEKAITDYSQMTPLELAGNEAEKSLKILNSKLKSVGEAKKELTKRIANRNVGNIAQETRSNIRKNLQERTGTEMVDEPNEAILAILDRKSPVIKDAPGRTTTISDSADINLLKQIDDKLKKVSEQPNFQKVDDAIDYMQDLLFKRKANLATPVNGKVEGVIKSAIRDLNQKLRVIGGKEYQDLNDLYSNYIGVRDVLNKALGTDANKGAALMKQLFSPAGTAPRKLFAKLKAMTGVDLVEEATLAKFAMENIGDVRQASLLEQVVRGGVSPTPKGIIQYAAEKLIKKIQNPIEKGRNILKEEGKLINQ